jgi:hypothetical protein
LLGDRVRNPAGETGRVATNPRPFLAIYRVTSTPAKFLGIVYDQPDAESAITRSADLRARRSGKTTARTAFVTAL